MHGLHSKAETQVNIGRIVAVTSLIMMSSCIKLSRQHKLPLGAMKGPYVHFLCEKNVFKNNVAVAS